MSKTWIIVSHRAGARILENSHTGMRLVSDINHDAGKLKDGEIDSDRPGRAFDRKGGGRHAMSTEESPHDHVAHGFARELAEVLRVGRNERRYDRLVLVAEPRFLGMLRSALDHETAALVRDTVIKDLAHVSLHDLPDFLHDVRML